MVSVPQEQLAPVVAIASHVMNDMAVSSALGEDGKMDGMVVARGVTLQSQRWSCRFLRSGFQPSDWKVRGQGNHVDFLQNGLDRLVCENRTRDTERSNSARIRIIILIFCPCETFESVTRGIAPKGHDRSIISDQYKWCHAVAELSASPPATAATTCHQANVEPSMWPRQCSPEHRSWSWRGKVAGFAAQA